MRNIILLITLFFYSFICAQDTERSPLFGKPSIERLTQRVIADATTDHDKVLKIHEWITHNIKYDIDKYARRDYSEVSTWKIVKKKKAICSGYSSLFNEMCSYAGITSVMVPGYAKSADWDQCDSFFLDEHAWNAVLIDNKWFMVDNTWDAGFVKYYRLTVPSFIAIKILKIPYIKMVYDPKFIFAPHQKYFLKSGEYFSADHLASVPKWQLIEPVISIEDFQNDSTFYYGLEKEDKKLGSPNNSERKAYVELGQWDQIVSSGQEIYAFNHRNQYGIAITYFTSGEDLYYDLVSSESSNFDRYEEVFEHMTNAEWHCDSNKYFLNMQYDALARNLDLKRDLQKEYNKKFSKYIAKDIKFYNGAKKKLKSVKSSLDKNYKRMNTKYQETITSQDFQETEFKHRMESVLDSFEMSSLLDSTQRMFYRRVDSIGMALNQFTEVTQNCSARLENELAYVQNVMSHFLNLQNLRFAGYDDFDYPIISAKNGFNYPDSFLYVYGDKLQNYFSDEFKANLKLIKRTDKDFRKCQSMLKKLKRMQNENMELPLTYNTMLTDYREIMDKSFLWMKEIKQFSGSYTRSFKKIAKASKKTQKKLRYEVEIYMDKKALKYHSRALLAENRKLESAAIKIKRKSERQIRKLLK